MPSKRRKSKGSRHGGFRRDVPVDGNNPQGVPRCSREHGVLNERDSEPVSQRANSGFTSPPEKESIREGSASSAVIPSVDGENHEVQETRHTEEHDSERSTASPSADSGFTSPSGNDSFHEVSASSPVIHSQQEQEESALRKLGFELNQELPKTVALPKRPGFGKFGKRIKLISNCYPLKVPEGNVYHYDVEVFGIERNADAYEVTGEERKVEKYRCLKTKEKRRVVESMLERDAVFDGLYAAYDGEKNLYTREPLRASFPHTFTTPDEDEIRARVKIKPVKKRDTRSCAINLDSIHAYYEKQADSFPMEAIAALETILRHGPCLRLVPIGHNFFSPPGPGCQNPLAGGLEIWFGYHQSLRLGQWSPMVNLDISASTFFPGGPLLEYIARFLDTTVDALRRTPFLSDRDRNRLNRRLKNRKIEATHTHIRRKYTVIGLVGENAHNRRFDVGGGNVQSVAAYFKERYTVELQYPSLPVLRLKPEERNVYLPVEVCKLIPGQHYNLDLTQAQRAEMIKFTSPAPKQRFQQIDNNLNFKHDRCAQEFELEVSEVPVSVEGRILDPPSLIYGGDQKIRPRDGAWNMRGAKFFQGAVIKSWALLSFADFRRGILEKFGKLMTETGSNLGLDIKEPSYTNFVNDRYNMKTLFSILKEKHDLVIVVIPDSNEAIYKHVKKSAEIAIGLITSCVMEKTVKKITHPESRCRSQLLTNIFLKINSKMAGVNYSLVLCEIPSILWKPTIVIGADVNHPGASRGLKESLAACSGSLDARCSLYAVRTRPQINEDQNKKSVEVILDLQAMVVDLLRAFYRHTRQKPEKIIVYRDGVSEGEFLKIRDSEVMSIRKACKELPDYEPGITFIVVQKRHHLRFVTEGQKLNIEPGTVIDTGVTHPENFDFFLGPHKSPKGTVKPAHYTVIADDNGFTADDLQKFTNQLCFCNVRCTKSISIPAPVLYAHLAAYRARQYLDAGGQGSAASSSGSSAGRHQQVSIEDLMDSTTVVQELKNRMYFV